MRDICLSYVIGQLHAFASAKGKKRPHEVHLDDDDAHLPVNDDSEDERKASSMEEEVDDSGEP